MAVILATGLVPEVRVIPARQKIDFRTLEIDVALPTPDVEHLHLVTLFTAVDSIEAPRGTFVSAWVTPNRPELRARSTVLELWTHFGCDWNRDYERDRRERLGIPSEAVVTDVATLGGIRRRIDWWEVEA